MTALSDDLRAAPLGHATGYPDTYDAALLFPVPRAPQREEIGIAGVLPFTGADVWTAFELTWLDPHGKPVVAIALPSVSYNSNVSFVLLVTTTSRLFNCVMPSTLDRYRRSPLL